jgi:hypothetical protein
VKVAEREEESMIFGKTKEIYFWAGRLERGNRLEALCEIRFVAQAQMKKYSQIGC